MLLQIKAGTFIRLKWLNVQTLERLKPQHYMWFPKYYLPDSNNITIFLTMTLLSKILFLKKEDCYHGNQFTAVLMTCNNT